MVRKTKERKEKKIVQKIKQNVKQSVHIHINEKGKANGKRRQIEKSANQGPSHYPFTPSLVYLGVPESSGEITSDLLEKWFSQSRKYQS